MPAAPLVIAHRGASALRPEHTLAAYALAIELGADFVEPDLVPTRDGVLVARHEAEIGATTDVASHPEFAARRTEREIDGRAIAGWFVDDFTFGELRTLRAREPLPDLRSTAHDGRHAIPSLDEIIALVAAEAGRLGRAIGLIPELKHPSHFRARGLAPEPRVLERLDAHAYTRTAPVVIQSFETANLRELRNAIGDRPNIRLLQLLKAPARTLVDAPRRTYAELATPAGLREVAEYAHVLSPPARAIHPVDAMGRLAASTRLVADAQAAGLRVMPHTYRPENRYLPRALWLGDDPRTSHPAGSIAEIRAALAAGVDGFFTDHPGIGRAAVTAHLADP